MNVCLDEHRLGALRWIVLRGPDREAFRALGEHTRAQISALAEVWPLLPRLRAHVCGPPGRDRLAVVRQASAERFPEVWAELASLAEGAAVPLDDLALLNFRGDLGQVTGGIGCSDLAWRRERSVIGHNEDGAPENVGQCALLTLALDGRPPVTAFWYPGFLPSNAFAVTGDGLVWTIDHLPVASPGDGAARHFVGRGLQRSARTLDAAVGYLRTHPSAGGFAYTIGDRAGRIVSVEAVAGSRRPEQPAWPADRRWPRSASRPPSPARPGSWTCWPARPCRTASGATPRRAEGPPRCAPWSPI
jgi:hypothetical protein